MTDRKHLTLERKDNPSGSSLRIWHPWSSQPALRLDGREIAELCEQIVALFPEHFAGAQARQEEVERWTRLALERASEEKFERIKKACFESGELVAFRDDVEPYDLGAANFTPHLYFLVRDEEIVYVGATFKLFSRMRDHIATKAFDSAYTVKFGTYQEMLRAETFLIRTLQPLLNERGCDKDLVAARRSLRDAE